MATAVAKAKSPRRPPAKPRARAAVGASIEKTAEAVWNGPFFGFGELGGSFGINQLGDGWQQNLSIGPWALRALPIVEAIRHLHRSAFAQLTPHHYEKNGGKITDRIDTTQIRTLLFPNAYETGAEFSARIGDEWCFNGEVLIWGIRNDRTEVSSMHIVPHRTWTPVVDHETKEIGYAINQSGELLTPSDASIIVPNRDVMHLRWSTPRHPLIGEGPFRAAGLAAGIAVALSSSQTAFFQNMRRPSGVLSTDQPLNKSQMIQLREAFDAQSKELNSGGVPVLAYGLKFQPMGINPEDANVIETQRMGNEDIARCAGVPLPLVGDLTNLQPANIEALMSWWLAISLGGLIERFERSYDRFFNLNSRTAWIDLDTTELLRMELGKRMDALGKGIQNGVLTVDEARDRSLENLSHITGGDGAFMQRQMTPVALLAELAAAELKKAQAPPPPPPAPPPAPAPAPAPEPTPAPPPAKSLEPVEGDEEVARALSIALIQKIKGQA